jgi:hypothetical protein
MQWVEQNLNESVCVVTLEFVFATFPTSIFANVGTALRIVKEKVGRSSKVLLAMCIVALTPVVNRGVAYGAE